MRRAAGDATMWLFAQDPAGRRLRLRGLRALGRHRPGRHVERAVSDARRDRRSSPSAGCSSEGRELSHGTTRQHPSDDEKRSYGAVWLVLSLLLLVGGAVGDRRRQHLPPAVEEVAGGLQPARDQPRRGPDRRRSSSASTPTRPTRRRRSSSPTARAERRLRRRRRRRSPRLEREARGGRARGLREGPEPALRQERARGAALPLRRRQAPRAADRSASSSRSRDGRRCRSERQKIYAESQAHIEDLRSADQAKRASRQGARGCAGEAHHTRDELQQKLENISLGHLPGSDGVVPVRRRRVAAEDPEDPAGGARGVRPQRLQPAGGARRPLHVVPRRHRQAGLRGPAEPVEDPPASASSSCGKHDPDKFGCTPCHNGDGTAVNSEQVRALQLLRRRRAPARGAPARGARALPRREDADQLHQVPPERRSTSRGAESVARGEKLFVELGCHGCHLAEGYEDLAKEDGVIGDRAVAAPHRRQGRPGLAGALDHESARVSGRARACRTSCSRREQAEQIAAYLLDVTKDAERGVARRRIRTRTIVAGCRRWRSTGGS